MEGTMEAQAQQHTDKRLVICNWKAYLGIAESVRAAEAIAESFSDSEKGCLLAIAPANLALCRVGEIISKAGISLCAQDIDIGGKGAKTGSTPIEVLEEAGCEFAIIGHSERRHRKAPETKESDALINRKLDICLNSQIIPILCTGETEEERYRGATNNAIKKQLVGGLEGISAEAKESIEKLVVAYEPVWAISSNRISRIPDVTEVNEACKMIRRHLYSLFVKEKADRIRIIYGGSVEPANVSAYLSVNGIRGVLVGKVGTDAAKMEAMLKAVGSGPMAQLLPS